MEIKLHFVQVKKEEEEKKKKRRKKKKKKKRRSEKKDQHVNITMPIISYFITVILFFLTTPTALWASSVRYDVFTVNQNVLF